MRHRRQHQLAPKLVLLSLLLLALALPCAAVKRSSRGDVGGVAAAAGRRVVVDSSEEHSEEGGAAAADNRTSPVGGGPGYDREVVSWMMQQASMYQTRVALLSVELDKRGYTGVRGVIPQPQGLICAQSTAEHPLRCRVYMEPEEGSKVVAPCRCKGSQRW
jgi:hypothetical protein